MTEHQMAFNPDDFTEEQLLEILAKKQAEKKAKYEELDKQQTECYEWMEAERQAYAEEEERNKVYIISSAGIVETYDGEKLALVLNHFNENIVAIFRSELTRIYDYNKQANLIDIDAWPALKEKFLELAESKKVKLELSPGIEDTLKDVKRKAMYAISRDEKAYYIETGKKAKSYEIRGIPGCTLDDRHKRWKFPLTEAWQILLKMNKLEDEGSTVSWEDDAKTFAEEQYARRLSLDAIASKELSDVKITLNGHTFHEYQNLTVEFGEAQGNRFMCAHEMGLGKTPCAIALAERMCERGEGQTILIICPASLIPNWQKQLAKFTNLYAYKFTGEHPEKFDMAMALSHKYRYYIINYDILSTVTKIPEKREERTNEKTGQKETLVIPAHDRQLWVEVINNLLRPDMVIIDEAHYIQNFTSNRSKAVREIGAPRVIPLSGTPFTSYAPQLWPVLNLLAPDVAGGFESFVKFYTVDGKNAKNIEDLRNIMRPLMFRKTKREVLKELPPINRITREVDLSAPARKRYDDVLNNGVYTLIDEWSGDEVDSKTITSILAQLMVLKQICVQDRVDYIADLATELHDNQVDDIVHNKVIIFTQFVNSPPVINLISRRLGQEALSFSGEDSPTERLKIVDKFQSDPDYHYLVCSIKAAGEGLDITAAGSVIFADLMWTPASHHQAEARAYGRLSDLHTISSYYIQAEKTIEETIVALLASKLATFNAVIEGTEETRMSYSIAMELIKSLKAGRRNR